MIKKTSFIILGIFLTTFLFIGSGCIFKSNALSTFSSGFEKSVQNLSISLNKDNETEKEKIIDVKMNYNDDLRAVVLNKPLFCMVNNLDDLFDESLNFTINYMYEIPNSLRVGVSEGKELTKSLNNFSSYVNKTISSQKELENELKKYDTEDEYYLDTTYTKLKKSIEDKFFSFINNYNILIEKAFVMSNNFKYLYFKHIDNKIISESATDQEKLSYYTIRFESLKFDMNKIYYLMNYKGNTILTQIYNGEIVLDDVEFYSEFEISHKANFIYSISGDKSLDDLLIQQFNIVNSRNSMIVNCLLSFNYYDVRDSVTLSQENMGYLNYIKEYKSGVLENTYSVLQNFLYVL